MPYKILKRENKWVVINKTTKDVKGTHSSKQKAVGQMGLLYGIHEGRKPTGQKGQSMIKRIFK